MKKSFLGGIFIFLPCVAVEENATRGAITEAVFIIQNKQVEVQEDIQGLKKALTECLLAPVVSGKNKGNQLKGYHCLLKEMIYPCSIKELEVLVASMGKSVDAFLQEKPVQKDELRVAVDDAFLLKNKVEAEAQILALVIAIDKQQCMLKKEDRQRSHPRTSSSFHHIVDPKRNTRKGRSSAGNTNILRRDLDLNKKKLREARRALARINTEIYKKNNTAAERMYLENLACFAI